MRYHVLGGMQLLNLSSSPLSIYIMVVRVGNVRGKGYFLSGERWGSKWVGIKKIGNLKRQVSLFKKKMMSALMSKDEAIISFLSTKSLMKGHL